MLLNRFIVEIKKRGASHLDIIISLTFFLLFIAWFFVFLRPLSEPKEDYNTLSWIIERNIENLDWEVQRVMLFIKSNISGIQPIFVTMPFNWDEKNILFQDGTPFCIEDNKIFFYSNLSEKNSFYLIHSSHNFTLPSVKMNAEKTYATAENLRMEFTDSMLKNISYNNRVSLINFSLAFNNVTVIPENSSFSNRGILAKYSFDFGNINHSSFVFSNTSKIISFINSQSEKNINLSFHLTNFSHYYADNENNGLLNYSNILETTHSFFGRYIDFYDADDFNKSISFIFNRTMNFRLNAINNQLVFTAMTNSNDLEYEIILHSGDYLSTINHTSAYSASFSILQNLTGMSEKRVNASNVYDILSIGYPSTRKFKVLFSFGDKSIQSGTREEPSTDIYSKEIEDFILYENGTKQKCRIRISVW